MRTPRAVNSLIDDLFERKYRKVGQEKKTIRIFFSRRVFCFNIVTPGKGSKYREFYDLSGRITCMTLIRLLMESIYVMHYLFSENKGTVQTGLMHRLICVFVVLIWQKLVFSNVVGNSQTSINMTGSMR